MFARLAALALALISLAVVSLSGAAAADGGGPSATGQVGYHLVGPGENLLDIARHHDLGYVELQAANPGVDPWLPRPGTMITLPVTHVPPASPREGIVINLGEMRLYWYAKPDAAPETYPVGIGEVGVDPGVGRTRVVRKRVNPTWVVPPSIRREEPSLPPSVPPGPDNPLGAYSLDLGRDELRIHGTDKPDGVGRRVSHGCYRMYPEDIQKLFSEVPVGTPVTVVDQPAALAWMGRDLYLLVHPSLSQADQLEDWLKFTPAPVDGLDDRIRRATGDEVGRVDWQAVARAVAARRGLPERITRSPALGASLAP